LLPEFLIAGQSDDGVVVDEQKLDLVCKTLASSGLF